MRFSLRRLSLAIKISLLGIAGVLVAAVFLVALAVWQSTQYNRLAQSEVNALIDADLDHIAQNAYNLVQTEDEAVQAQNVQNLHIARTLLQRTGTASLSRDSISWNAVNQFTGGASAVTLPKLLIGGTWLGRHRSFQSYVPVVDDIRQLTGETATVFQRINQKGDMLRIATTVKTPAGERAIGTTIPAVNPDGSPNPVISAVLKGETYTGRAYVVSEWYLTCYEPLKDKAGRIIGMLFVGLQQQAVENRIRHAILQVQIGKTGYVYVISGRGESRGQYVISFKGERDGENVWETKDAEGHYVIQSIINEALHLPPGGKGTIRYRWQNPGEPEARWKIARLMYYAPWDWVIGTSVYEDELQVYSAILDEGRTLMIRNMTVAGIFITLLAGFCGLWIAWTIIRPIRKLTAIAEAANADKLDQTVSIDTADELGTLAGAFNRMTLRLRQSMEELRISESRYRSIVENALEGLFQASRDGILLNANPRLASILGYESPADMLASGGRGGIRSHFTSADWSEFLSLLSREGYILDREFRMFRKDGSAVWIALSAQRIASEEYPEGIIEGFLINISDRKQAEQALLESRTYLDRIINSVADPIFVKDRDHRWILLNDAFCEFLGYSRDDLLGKTDFDLLPKEQADVFWKMDDLVFSTGTENLNEEVLTDAHGEIRTIVTKKTLYIDDQERKYLVGIFRDITEQKNISERLENLNKQLQNIIEFLPDATFIIDRDRTIIAWNRAIEEITGVPKADIIGKSHSAASVPFYGYPRPYLIDLLFKDEAEITSRYSFVKRRGQSLFGEAFTPALYNGKGAYIWAIASPLYDYEGRFDGAIESIRDISEQKQALMALEESELKYSRIVNMANEGICSLDARHNIDYVNPKMLDMLGYPVDAVLGKPMAAFIPDDEQEDHARKMEERKRGSAARYERRMIRSDGSLLTVSISATPRFDEAGAFLGSFAMMTDITERRRAEQALIESEERFRRLAASAQDGIVIMENDGTCSFWNQAAERIFGFSGEEVLGKSIHGLLAPERYRGMSSEGFSRFRDSGRGPVVGQLMELEMRRKDGTEFPCELSVSAFKFRDRWISLGILRDITERKRTEQALNESRGRYQAVFENNGNALILINEDMTISMCNKEFEVLSGYTKAEVEGRILWPAFISRTDELEMMKHYHRLRRIGDRSAPSSYECHFRDRSGNERDIVLIVTMLPGTAQSLAALLDMTKLRQAEEERKRLETQLFQSQKLESIGTLAAGIAHDFNNILNIILGTTALLTSAPSNREKFMHRMDTITKAGERGALLVQQLLTFARKTEIERRPVDINDLVHETATLVEETFPKTIEISLRLYPSLPITSGDRNQLHQILVNLFVNARDAMPRGGTLSIGTDCVDGSDMRRLHPFASAGQYIIIRVSDTGTGMSEETRLRIFDPFFTTKEPGKGTGLGLAVVLGIVEHHGGFIDVDSRPGAGTEFRIALPVKEQLIESAAQPAPSIEAIAGGRETILIVEDELESRLLIEDTLSRKGYTVLTAGDGDEAMREFEQSASRIALVISDLGLPKIDGAEVCRRMRQRLPRLPIMVMSGFIDGGKRAELARIGVNRIMTKPYRLADVLSTVRSLLDEAAMAGT